MATGLALQLQDLLGIQPEGGPTNIDPLAQKDMAQQDQMRKAIENFLAPPKKESKWGNMLFEAGKRMANSQQGLVGSALEGAQGGFQAVRDTRLQNRAEKEAHTEKLIKTALGLTAANDKQAIAEGKLAIAQQGADVAKLRAEMYGKNIDSMSADRLARQGIAQDRVNAWKKDAEARLTLLQKQYTLNGGKETWDRETDISEELSRLRTSFGDTTFMSPEARADIEGKIEAERFRLRSFLDSLNAGTAPGTAVVPNTSVPPETAQPIPTPLDPARPKAKAKIGDRMQWSGFVWTYNGVKWVRGNKVQ